MLGVVGDTLPLLKPSGDPEDWKIQIFEFTPLNSLLNHLAFGVAQDASVILFNLRRFIDCRGRGAVHPNGFDRGDY
jgi:hypothetical protein